MELTILLAKIFGIYMLVAGVAILLNRRHVMLGIFAMAKERFAQLIAGYVALLTGLLLVNVHNDWSTFPASIISLIGWSIVLKGVLYLFMPEAKLSKLVHTLSERKWFVIDGILIMIVGLYLAAYGYQIF